MGPAIQKESSVRDEIVISSKCPIRTCQFFLEPGEHVNTASHVVAPSLSLSLLLEASPWAKDVHIHNTNIGECKGVVEERGRCVYADKLLRVWADPA